MNDAELFAEDWIAAWNARDLDRVLRHYSDDVELTSPRARSILPESGGVIRGKAALRAYWTVALAASPSLRFELVSVLQAVDGATILYDNHRGERVSETVEWNAERRVVRSIVASTVLPRRTVHCVVAHVPRAGVEAFQRYEARVLPLLEAHGARLVRRLSTDDRLTEVHLIEVEREGAIEAYRADARRAELQPWLEESGARIESFRMRDLPVIE